MKKLLLLLALLCPISAFGAVHAVVTSATCTNNGDGTSWSCASGSGQPGAYVGIPGTLTRGDIYYLCDGNYGNTFTFNTADSSSSTVEFRKAQSYDYGSLSGWSTATCGSSQARLAYWTSKGSSVSITTDYVIFNGNSQAQGTSTIGCGGVQANPPTWVTDSWTVSNTVPNSTAQSPPTPADCGILFDFRPCTATGVTSTNGCDNGNGEIHSTGHNITFEGVEMAFAGIDFNGDNNAETYGWLAQGGGSNNLNITMVHNYAHNEATTCITAGSGGNTNGVFEYNYFWGVYDGTANHGECFQTTGTDTNTNIDHNVFRDNHTNGIFFVAVDPTTGTHSNWNIFNNVAYCSPGQTCRSSDGIFACINSSQTCTGFNIYNNDIIGNMTNNSGVVCTNACTGNLNNNVWYGTSLTGISLSALTQDYNSCINCTITAATHNVSVASGGANPFPNASTGSFAPASGSDSNYDSRLNIGTSPYDGPDIYGNNYSSGTAGTRGAAQYEATVSGVGASNGMKLSFGAQVN